MTTSLDQLVRDYADAYAQADRARLDAVLEQVPQESHHEFFAHVERLVQPEPVAFDRSSLERALQRAGADDGDARRRAALATGDLQQFVQVALEDGECTIESVAAQITEQLDELDAADAPRVRRYLERLVDGRHDARRVSRRALDAIAAALDAAGDTLEMLRDRTAGAPGLGVAAARGAGDEPVALGAADPDLDDAVDRLFNAPAS